MNFKNFHSLKIEQVKKQKHAINLLNLSRHKGVHIYYKI